MALERFEEQDFLACCGSTKFAKEMVLASPFTSLEEAIAAARNIWFNKVDVNGWLEAFSSHPQIGQSPSSAHTSHTAAQWSKGEQSTALSNFYWFPAYRPIVEFEIAAQEQMKVTELRLGKLFSTKTKPASSGKQHPTVLATKVEEDRVAVVGGHLKAAPNPSSDKASQVPTRTRPPITTHVLDVSRGSSITDVDGRSGQLMSIVNDGNPGIYRISFNTGKYCPSGFFPYVSIVFEIKESQNREHFHVPLLLSPFSFSTYRGS
ncbi:hypothetical protein GH714_022008 [Hevea brasiliensis]|uniref:2-oxo-4-hydroxy-4-carboxy-5-ureidoimidazoline decarboxylase n=1 Tax=Hevea brasiliensis TaxID=3981 RepID=A0A6A6K8U7_HEVBR|nr:hypothetical protein GH714_022008 [Hevea brasiliensis]